MVNAARTEPPLRDFKAPAFTEEDVGNGYPDVLEEELGVAVGRVIEAEDRQHALDGEPRPGHRHEDHRLLPVSALVPGIGLSHHDQDPAARIESARGPPLASVDDVVASFALDADCDIGRVGGGGVRLGHREGGADLPREQGRQPLFLLLVGPIAHQHFHVAGIGGGAVEHLGGEGGAAHFLAGGRVVEVGETRPVFAFRQEEVPQARGLRLLLERLEERNGREALAFLDLAEHRFLVGIDVLFHETRDRVADFLRPIAVLEVHSGSSRLAARPA